MEGLSDFVGSEKDDKEDVDAKPAGKASQRKQASQSNQHVKSVLQELEAESVTDEEGSVDSLLSDDEGERKVSSRAGIDKERQHFIYSPDPTKVYKCGLYLDLHEVRCDNNRVRVT